jgi:hypothetical protein
LQTMLLLIANIVTRSAVDPNFSSRSGATLCFWYQCCRKAGPYFLMQVLPEESGPSLAIHISTNVWLIMHKCHDVAPRLPFIITQSQPWGATQCGRPCYCLFMVTTLGQLGRAALLEMTAENRTGPSQPRWFPLPEPESRKSRHPLIASTIET